MKKRLRKKKHLGEFQELGAEIVVRLHAGTDFDAFLDKFLDAVEKNGLRCGGGGMDRDLSVFVELGRRDEAEAMRARLDGWLSDHEDVERYALGETVDASYPPEDLPDLELEPERGPEETESHPT
jgi:uncharacterized protein YggL (DUF469 family)